LAKRRIGIKKKIRILKKRRIGIKKKGDRNSKKNKNKDSDGQNYSKLDNKIRLALIKMING
jgi:hypothetical protein